MPNTLLVTVSDDRSGRKFGQYAATQRKIEQLLAGTMYQKHYTIDELIDCDPLMVNPNGGKNGRVYKPWAILDSLKNLNWGDYLIYNDCSPEMWPDGIDLSLYDLDIIRVLTDLNADFLTGFVKWDDKPIPAWGLGRHIHHWYTLDSCLAIMRAEEYRYSYLCASGMICIRKTPKTVDLVDTWLYYNRIPECSCFNVDEQENSYWSGSPGYKIGNRHDQSVLSVVLNKLGYDYCDIAYNALNPYNFLNFCLPGHDYKFISSIGRNTDANT